MRLASKFRRWLGIPERFTAADFRKRDKLRSDYAVVAGCLLERLDFRSAYDVGCANGFLLEEFDRCGKEIGGIELVPDVVEVLPESIRPAVAIGDFGEAAGRWDLVCCVELAEHIEPSRSEDLVETVTRLARRWIYFTAAPPGQKGHGHINCRPIEDWLGWYGDRGWTADERLTGAIRDELSRLERAHWLRGNSCLLTPRT